MLEYILVNVSMYVNLMEYEIVIIDNTKSNLLYRFAYNNIVGKSTIPKYKIQVSILIWTLSWIPRSRSMSQSNHRNIFNGISVAT